MGKREHNYNTVYEEVKREGYRRKKIQRYAKRENDKEILIKKRRGMKNDKKIHPFKKWKYKTRLTKWGKKQKSKEK